MAKIKTEQFKKHIAAILKEGPVSLCELCRQVEAPAGLLTGALQSMLAKGEVKMEPAGDKAEDIRIEPAGGNNEGESSVTAQMIAAGVAACKSRLYQEACALIEQVLGDGLPRTESELAGLVPLSGVRPEAVPGVVVLPDGRYTLGTVEAGRKELERRKKEAALHRERVHRQEQIVNELLENGKAIPEEELQEALGEPLVLEVARQLVLLTGGKYALPDSPAAWEDIAVYIRRRGPVSRKEFYRVFKPHKKLVAEIKKGKEPGSFVLLPDGRVTVAGHPAGQKELRRREVLARVRRELNTLLRERAYFTLEKFDPEEEEIAVAEAIREGCSWVEYEGRCFWCSPVKFTLAQMARELESYTGLEFPATGGQELPVVYLLDNSLTPGEVARRVAISPGQVINLYRAGYLPALNLEGSLRIWQPGLAGLQGRTALARALKRTEEISLPEAARMLGVPPEMVRRLVKEGYLTPAEGYDRKKRQGAMAFRRGDIEDLLGLAPRLKEKWESARARRFDKTGGKRKPLRREETPSRVQEGPVVLDRFQKEAIEALEAGNSVLVAAPTGTGKTLIAEKLVARVLKQGREVIYTSPIKALSNQKFRDFAKLYGRDKVGLITGDVSINERAPLLVMTTEIFRNWCFSNPEWMANISYVIFDEIHYLDDPERGTAWEESIIFAPPHIRILGLSATVPNVRELADWMHEVRQYPVVVVEEKERAVPLSIKWVTSSGEVLNEREAREEIKARLEETQQDRFGHKKFGTR